MQALQRSWTRAWSSWGLPARPGLMDELLGRWAEPHRDYHALAHLQACLAHLEPVLHLAQQPAEVKLALWFHDAIYDLKAHDNEARSADWARREMLAAGVHIAAAERVHQLVMATCHAALPATPDEQLLVDIDLAILGAPADAFAVYEAQIRQEYSWVPGWLFRRKRKAILRGLLARQPLYNTEHFRQQLEAQARANLAQAIR